MPVRHCPEVFRDNDGRCFADIEEIDAVRLLNQMQDMMEEFFFGNGPMPPFGRPFGDYLIFLVQHKRNRAKHNVHALLNRVLAGIDFHHVLDSDFDMCLAEPGVALQGKDMRLESIALVKRIWNLVEISSFWVSFLGELAILVFLFFPSSGFAFVLEVPDGTCLYRGTSPDPSLHAELEALIDDFGLELM